MKKTVNISPKALLHRPLIEFDTARTDAEMTGKVILVTGAGGSIGSDLSQRICDLAFAHVIFIEKSENELYELENRLQLTESAYRTTFVLGDVCDASLVEDIFKRHRPQIVFHAAALKHVPLLEQHPLAAIHNNVLGTFVLVRNAIRYRAENLVMLSTDKAVNPASIMGASKRIAEIILRAFSTNETRLTSVRFGNVLGSRGSVMPKFIELIENRLPLTVTHTEATRYFMTAHEAVETILSAVWLGRGGDTLIPNLGNPKRIFDLAKEMIEIAGLMKDKDIPIILTGLRPGEKLHEELLSSDETSSETKNQSIRRVESPAFSAVQIEDYVGRLAKIIERRDAADLINQVCEILPKYRPSAKLLEYVHKRTGMLCR